MKLTLSNSWTTVDFESDEEREWLVTLLSYAIFSGGPCGECMKLTLNNRLTTVDFESDEEQGWLVAFLSFEDSANSFYMADGKAGYSGSTRRLLYNHKSRGFPAGLTGMVYRRAMTQGFQVQVDDHRKWPADPLGREVCEWLYPFQQDAVDRALSRTRGIISVPTAGGKGEQICALMLRTPTVRWLMLAPETDLMYNIARRYPERPFDNPTGEQVGLLGDGKDTTEGKRIVCATIQTIGGRLADPTRRHATEEFLKGFQGVIVDEAHMTPSDQAYGVLTAMENAFYRIGFSGTALSRTDSRNLFTLMALGDVVYEIKPQLLMDMGIIARPNITFVPHRMKPPKTRTFAGAYRECITGSKSRNALLVELAEQAQKPCIMFVKHEKHGKELQRLLKASGKCASEFIYGKHSMDQRDKALDRLSWGDTEIAICTKIWQTGTDIPDLRSLVIGTGGQSGIEAIQRVGRALRVVKGPDGEVLKDTADIWDIMDEDSKIVNPATGRKKASKAKWFADHAKARQAHYLSNGYPVIVLDPEDCVKFGVVT